MVERRDASEHLLESIDREPDAGAVHVIEDGGALAVLPAVRANRERPHLQASAVLSTAVLHSELDTFQTPSLLVDGQ